MENKCWQETFHLSSDKLETGGLFLSYREWQVNVTPPVGMTVKTNKKRTPVVFTQNHHDTGKSAEKSETWTKKTQAVVSLTSGSHFKAPKKAHYYCMTPFEFHSFGEKHISTANISSQWLHPQQQVRNLGKRCRRRWKLLILMPPLIMVISLISYVMFFSRVTQHVICLYTMYITGNSTHTCHPFVNRPAWLVYIAQKGLDPIIECLVSCTGVEH